MAKMDSKAVRIINRLLDGGYESEKAILAMTMDDILALPNVRWQISHWSRVTKSGQIQPGDLFWLMEKKKRCKDADRNGL